VAKKKAKAGKAAQLSAKDCIGSVLKIIRTVRLINITTRRPGLQILGCGTFSLLTINLPRLRH
jgi:hypothetical protein